MQETPLGRLVIGRKCGRRMNDGVQRGKCREPTLRRCNVTCKRKCAKRCQPPCRRLRARERYRVVPRSDQFAHDGSADCSCAAENENSHADS